MEPAVFLAALLIFVGIPAFAVIKVARIRAARTTSPSPDVTARLEALERSVQDLQHEVGETQERLDFTERLLSKARMREHAASGSDERSWHRSAGDGDRELRPWIFCGDHGRLGNLGPDPRQFHPDMDGGAKECSRASGTSLSVRLDLSGIWHRPTLAAGSRRRLPLAAQLVLGLAAAV